MSADWHLRQNLIVGKNNVTQYTRTTFHDTEAYTIFGSEKTKHSTIAMQSALYKHVGTNVTSIAIAWGPQITFMVLTGPRGKGFYNPNDVKKSASPRKQNNADDHPPESTWLW